MDRGTMLTENRQFVEGLIIKLLRAVPLSALPDAVIFGSAAITLGGIDLERKVDDLDVFISETTFSQLVKDGQAEEYEKSPGVWALKIPRVAKVELLKTFPGVSHDGVLKRAKSHD